MYTTLAAVKEYLGIAPSQTGDDAILTRLIAAAKTFIDAYTHRSFTPSNTPIVVYKNNVFDDVIYTHADVLQVASIVTDKNITYTPNQLIIPTVPTRILALKKPHVFDLDDYLTVNGIFGFSFTTPPTIEQAAIRLVGHMYRLKDAQAYDVIGFQQTGLLNIAQSIPADVRALLEPYVAPDLKP